MSANVRIGKRKKSRADADRMKMRRAWNRENDPQALAAEAARSRRRRHVAKLDNQMRDEQLANTQLDVKRFKKKVKSLEKQNSSLRAQLAAARIAHAASSDSESVSGSEQSIDFDEETDESYFQKHYSDSGVVKYMQFCMRSKTKWRRAVAFPRHEYDIILQKLIPYMHDTTFRGTQRRRQPCIPADGASISVEQQIFITHYFLHCYRPLSELSYTFDLPERFVAQIEPL